MQRTGQCGVSGRKETEAASATRQRSQGRLRRVLRASWTVAAFGFVAWLLVTNSEIRIAIVQMAAAPAMLAGLGLLLFAKLLYAWGVAACLSAGGSRLGIRSAFHAYSLSQIGKYIPGGVWHFLGRHQIYVDHGIDQARSLRLIGMETALLVGSATFLGAVLAFLPWFGEGKDPDDTLKLLLAGLAGLASTILATAVAWFIVRPKLGGLLRALGIFCLAWAAAGLSLAVLLPEAPVMLSAPAYALSFAAGMVAVFAPAGIGVREAVFVFLAVPLVPAEAAAAAILAHRALYVLGDLAMAAAALPVVPPPRTSRQPNRR